MLNHITIMGRLNRVEEQSMETRQMIEELVSGATEAPKDAGTV